VFLRIFRYSPGSPERIEEYEIEAKPGMTVLDALVEVQRTQDPTLAFRYACHVGMCDGSDQDRGLGARGSEGGTRGGLAVVIRIEVSVSLNHGVESESPPHH
jgi:hypothetical protein